MKIFLLLWVIMMLSTFASVANSKNIINIARNLDIIADSNNLCGIFYEDIKNNIVIIDLEVIEDELSNLLVLKEREVVFRCNLKELTDEPVYELELDQFTPGDYTIQLVTDKNIRLPRKITIK